MDHISHQVLIFYSIQKLIMFEQSDEKEVLISYTENGDNKELRADALGAGRNIRGPLHVENAGIQVPEARGFINVNDHLQTNNTYLHVGDSNGDLSSLRFPR